MSLHCPTVSICLPVYNGQPFVREAINSILEQTFHDFELIISDNASTDATAHICSDAAARDSRIHYYRAEVNRGLAWNHNRTFALARGRYVAWIGHDDLLGPEYISRCVQALEEDSGPVLCYPAIHYIDECNRVIDGTYLKDPSAGHRNPGNCASPSSRFHNILCDNLCHAVFGVMKKEVLQQTGLHGGFAASDRVLLAEMALRGRFNLIPEYLFSRRVHAERTTRKYSGLRERTIIFDPAKAGKAFSPSILEASAHFSALCRAKLPLKERLRCYKLLLRWLWTSRRHDLWEDIRERIKLYLSEAQFRALKAAKRRFLQSRSSDVTYQAQ
jgi:glycosyltransferase involved in cell wall biosynthesis